MEFNVTDSEDEITEQFDFDVSNEFVNESGPSKPKRKRGKINFITANLVTFLDKCKVSDRDAVRILVTTAQALNHDVHDLVINKTSIHNIRSKLRVETGQRIKDKFKDEEIRNITLHWDGKILSSLIGKESIDRIPVVVSYNGKEQLLGIPAISSGTGQQQAEAVYDLLQEWSLIEKVEALCCDTTVSNLGRLKGACVLLEQAIGKDLLYLPCRHHIYEIILRSVFDEKMEKSKAPNVEIFNRFRDAWAKIDKINFISGLKDTKVNDAVGNVCEILKFAFQSLNLKQPRDYYKELLQLSIVFLGGTVQDFTFKKPGAFHHARWMAKAIYCLKIYLFQKEFKIASETFAFLL